MANHQRVRSQQQLREAEGYLDLILSLSDRFPLRAEISNRIAERALALLRPLQQTSRQQVLVWHLIGQALRAQGRYSEAVEALRQAARLDPDNLRIWLSLGWCHKRCGQLELAIGALEEALAVDGGEAIVHYNLACYWSLAGHLQKAVGYLGRAFEIDPNFRELVAEEADFDAIRHAPAFLALTAVIV